MISIFAARVFAGDGLLIFGDGQQTRDFVFVGDVAEALIGSALGSAHQAVANVGTGRETSIVELAAAIQKLAGKTVSVEHREARSGDIVRSRADIRQAEDVLGFRAATSLEQGLQQTLDWLRQAG